MMFCWGNEKEDAGISSTPGGDTTITTTLGDQFFAPKDLRRFSVEQRTLLEATELPKGVYAWLQADGFTIFAPNSSETVANLADSYIGLNAVEDSW